MSTPRLAILAAAVAVTVAILVILTWTPTTSRPAAPTITPSEPATPSYNPDAGDAAGDPGEGSAELHEVRWIPVAENFARNFTNTNGGPAAWRQRLIGNPRQPNVTTDVANQLKTVDPRNVPHGHYSGREVLNSSDYQIAVKVTYRENWALILYLITDGSSWQVYGYDRWEA